MPDFLDQKREEIDGRLAELEPLVDEYNRLLAAAAALAGVDGVDNAASAPSSPMTSPIGQQETVSAEVTDVPAADAGRTGSPADRSQRVETASDTTAASAGVQAGESPRALAVSIAAESLPARKAGRPKGSGTRAAEALKIVREHPGVSIPELADRMGIKQNYLYRVLPELMQEGKITKQGRGWHPSTA